METKMRYKFKKREVEHNFLKSGMLILIMKSLTIYQSNYELLLSLKNNYRF